MKNLCSRLLITDVNCNTLGLLTRNTWVYIFRRQKWKIIRIFYLCKSRTGRHSIVISTQTAHAHGHSRTTHETGYTLCLHSPITDSHSYAIMIDLPAWLMTGELPRAKSDGHDFRAGAYDPRSRRCDCAKTLNERKYGIRLRELK